MEVIERLHDLLGKVKDLYDNRVLSNLRRICRTCLVRIPTDMVTTERFIAEQHAADLLQRLQRLQRQVGRPS